MQQSPIAGILLGLPILIFSIVLHEVAHGWVARRQGDNTAAMLGRLTLNPIPHLDPIGSILVPALLAVTGSGMMFGWAKPVPVNPRNFRNYKRGDILVSLAGVAVNMALAVIFALIASAMLAAGGPMAPESFGGMLLRMLMYGVLINILLTVFNLLPIPPLDGSHVFYHLLPPKLGARYRELGRYGMLILFALLFITGFSFIRYPVELVYRVIATLTGLGG